MTWGWNSAPSRNPTTWPGGASGTVWATPASYRDSPRSRDTTITGYFLRCRSRVSWRSGDCDDEVTRQVAVYQARRDTLCRGLEGLGWHVEKPTAGMFVWARIPEPFSRMGSLDFVRYLAEHANVTMSPGIGFGQEGEGYVRIALVENEHRIRQALKQIRKAFRTLRDNPPEGMASWGPTNRARSEVA